MSESHLSPAMRRMLGFLAAHPGRYLVDCGDPSSARRSQWGTAKALDARGFAHAWQRCGDSLVADTPAGVAEARRLGLVCPGAETGECHYCRAEAQEAAE